MASLEAICACGSTSVTGQHGGVLLWLSLGLTRVYSEGFGS